MTGNIQNIDQYNAAVSRYADIATHAAKVKAAVQLKNKSVNVDNWEKEAINNPTLGNGGSVDRDALNKAVIARETAEKEMKAFIADVNTKIEQSSDKTYGRLKKEDIDKSEQKLSTMKQAVQEQVEAPLKALSTNDSSNPKVALQAKRDELFKEIQMTRRNRVVSAETMANDPAYQKLAQMDATLKLYNNAADSVSKMAQLKPAELEAMNKALANPLNDLDNGKEFKAAFNQINQKTGSADVHAMNFADAAAGTMKGNTSVASTLASTGGTAHIAYNADASVEKIQNRNDRNEYMAIPKVGLKNIKRNGDKVMAYYENGTVTEYKQDLIKDKEGKTTHVQTTARQMMKGQKGNYVVNPEQMPVVYTAASGKKGRETGVVVTSMKGDAAENKERATTALANVKTKGVETAIANGNLNINSNKDEYQVTKKKEESWVHVGGKLVNSDGSKEAEWWDLGGQWNGMFKPKTYVASKDENTIHDPTSAVAKLKSTQSGTSPVNNGDTSNVASKQPDNPNDRVYDVGGQKVSLVNAKPTSSTIASAAK
jgi:hypothetical protein